MEPWGVELGAPPPTEDMPTSRPASLDTAAVPTTIEGLEALYAHPWYTRRPGLRGKWTPQSNLWVLEFYTKSYIEHQTASTAAAQTSEYMTSVRGIRMTETSAVNRKSALFRGVARVEAKAERMITLPDCTAEAREEARVRLLYVARVRELFGMMGIVGPAAGDVEASPAATCSPSDASETPMREEAPAIRKRSREPGWSAAMTDLAPMVTNVCTTVVGLVKTHADDIPPEQEAQVLDLVLHLRRAMAAAAAFATVDDVRGLFAKRARHK